MFNKTIFSLCLLLLFINQISAFAVSSAYYEGNPLKMKPGETKDFIMFLQNTKGTELNVKAEISSGSDIIKITNSEEVYSVPATGKSIINLRAEIPEDAKVGATYPVNIEFATVNEQTGGFGFGTAIGQNFEIVVTKEDGTLPKPINFIWIILSGLGIAVITVGTIVLAKRKKKKKY